ncbi:MAG: P22 coat protein [Clostridia bacterium]|nr:P22 coat protein [Clostridia bacterium]
MANNFITLKTIARKALPALMDELVFPALCSRDLSEDFGELGDTVQVRKPACLEAREFEASQGVNYQDIKEESVDVSLSTLATVDVAAGAVETAVSLGSEEALERDFILPAARALAAKINSDGLKLYRDVYACVGTAGTPIDSLSDLADVRRALNLAKVPEFDRKLIIDPEADAKLIAVEQLASAAHSGDTRALRNGCLGRVFGMDVYTTQAVEKHTCGVSGASVTLESAASAGDTQAHLTATSLTGSFVKGDLIKIGSDSYTVTEGAACASNKATVKLAPALKAYDAGTSVTLIGSHTACLAFDPRAFVFVSRPLINPDGQGVESYVTAYNGLSLRVTKGYDQKYKKSTYSMDVLYGFRTVYPELAVRVLG